MNTPSSKLIKIYKQSCNQPTFNRNEAESVHGHVSGEHGEEAGHVAPSQHLPVQVEAVVGGTRRRAHTAQQHQVASHAEVGDGEVEYEEPVHGEAVRVRVAAVRHGDDDEANGIPHQRESRDEPRRYVDLLASEQVFARVEGIGHRMAFDWFRINQSDAVFVKYVID